MYSSTTYQAEHGAHDPKTAMKVRASGRDERHLREEHQKERGRNDGVRRHERR